MPGLQPINCLQSPLKYRGLTSSFPRGFNLTIDTTMTPFLAQICRRMLLAVLVAPLMTMAQSPSDLPPLPEDLIPALRPLLVSALAQSPQMIAQNISIASAEAALIQDRAGMLPGLSSSANYGHLIQSLPANRAFQARLRGCSTAWQ